MASAWLASGFVAGGLLLLVAADALVLRALPEPATENFRLLYETKPPAPAIHLWGTSHTLHGVDPCIVAPGRPAWHNFALNGSTPTYWRSWYAEWRAFQPPPRRVYLGLDPVVLQRLPWSRRFEQDSGFWPWGRLLARLRRFDADAATAALSAAHVVRRREDIQDRVAGIGERQRMLWADACQGFVPLAPKPDLGPKGSGFPDEPRYAEDLEALLRTLAADRVRLVCFQTPEYLGEAPVHPVDGTRLRALLARHGVPFLDYNRERRSDLNRDPGLYNDPGHLHRVGAARFSERLGRDLARAGLL